MTGAEARGRSASSARGIVGKTVSRIVLGGPVTFQLFGRVTKTAPHPVYGELVSVHFDSVAERTSRQAACDDAAASGGVDGGASSSSSTRLYSLEGLHCSELCWMSDLEIVSGETIN